jgi:hypothetical protein
METIMTMHLEKAYLSTTRYNNKTKKSKSKKLEQARSDHEAWLKTMGVGKSVLPTNKQGKRVGLSEIPDYRSNKPEVALSNTVAGHGPARQQQKYTGTLIKGVATMHKSNAVPISSREQAIEVSTMRRN